MLKFYYANNADIPDNLKGAYEAKNGRYELIKLADDHPVLAHNKTLLQEKTAVETERDTLKASVGNLERERDELKTKSVPAGYRAVSIEIADLGNAAKAADLSKDEIGALKTKVETFEKEKAEAAENEMRRKVADSLKLQPEAFADHAAAKGLKFAERTEKIDGKDVQYFVVVGENNSEERVNDYVKTKAAYLPTAAQKPEGGESAEGFQFPGESAGDKRPANEWDAIRNEAKAEAERAKSAHQPTSNIFAAALGGVGSSSSSSNNNK